jgi:hypothetical protein
MTLRSVAVKIDTPEQPAVEPTVVDGKPVPGKSAKKAGRDHGKTFIITEMGAFQTEWWAVKLTLALGKAGMELPEGATGMAGIAAAGLQVLLKLDPVDAKPLHDELLACCAYQHAANHPTLSIYDAGIVQDPRTVLTLLKEVFKLHTDFL